MTSGYSRSARGLRRLGAPSPVAPLVAAALASAMLSLAGAPAALAHDAVVGGSPADGEVVTEFPRTLELTFSGQVQDGFNTFALSNASTNEVIFSGEPHLDGRNVILDLPGDLKADPGTYRIGFQIISSDGHSTKGMTTFTYEPAGSSPSSGAPAATGENNSPEPAAGDGERSVSRALPLIAAGLGVLVIGGAAIALIGRKRRAETGSAAGEA
ncbi:copper resistance CopC family protein [Corynebacterium sp. UBA2622]|uniref:copper resistance CopC family protein n=1 Tax=Corynebacterium sp. UBA2622 TaxID=1946393 RepID=UPI0025C12131|nr:copper resistance CopC family protein [Corynebacterium sp. UBA2622]